MILSSTSITNMEGIDPRLIEIAGVAIELTIVDFGIPSTGGIRTQEEQYQLFCDGKSKCDGDIRKSYHQTGRALDFYAYTNGKASWDVGELAMVATAFLQAASILGYKLNWGGLWKSFRDMPHVQLAEE
jgi:peptidoglycan L-alanyl-D-glutamate endopeptidase CwlK